jgi:hypothetical protein
LACLDSNKIGSFGGAKIFISLDETSKKKHLRTSEGMPSAKGKIIMRVPYGLNLKL